MVIAATDGQVSRVKMSPWGYGSLYLDGPDRVTTVYAHLQQLRTKSSLGPSNGDTQIVVGVGCVASRLCGVAFPGGRHVGMSGNSGGRRWTAPSF